MCVYLSLFDGSVNFIAFIVAQSLSITEFQWKRDCHLQAWHKLFLSPAGRISTPPERVASASSTLLEGAHYVICCLSQIEVSIFIRWYYIKGKKQV